MTTQSSSTGALAGRKVNPLAGGVLGAVFVLVGLLGFLVSGGHPAAGAEGGLLLGIFEVNLLHNVVHLAVGAALAGGAIAGVRASKAVNTLVGGVYLAVGLVGLLIIGGAADIIALNGADNGLHIVSGLALLAVGLGTDRT
ncbi:MAG: DUF4383 domain-containing protein [Micromonosporaceae bacterium]